MKRKISLTLALLIALSTILLVGCSSSSVEVPDGMRLVSTDSDAFYLFAPGGWIDNTSSGAASAYYSDNDRSNVSMTCMSPYSISEDNPPVNAKEYVEVCRAELAAYMPGYEAVGEVSDVVMGGRNGKSFEYTASMGDVTYKYRQVVVVYQDLYYILTYTSTAEGYDLHTADIDKVIENVKFK